MEEAVEGKQEKEKPLQWSSCLHVAWTISSPFACCGNQASWRVGGGLVVKRGWPPSAFVLFLFFFIAGGNRPLRLGETLHLVREEILLRPLYDPLCFLLLLLLLGLGWGWGGALTTAPSCPHHHAPFAFLITLQMCLMAEQSLCTERGAPAGIQEACLCELS